MAATSCSCACGPQSALFRVPVMVRLQSATVEEPGEKKNHRCRPRTSCPNGFAVASVTALSRSRLVTLMKCEHRSRIALKTPHFHGTHHSIRQAAVQSYAVGQEPVCNTYVALHVYAQSTITRLRTKTRATSPPPWQSYENLRRISQAITGIKHMPSGTNICRSIGTCCEEPHTGCTRSNKSPPHSDNEYLRQALTARRVLSCCFGKHLHRG